MVEEMGMEEVTENTGTPITERLRENPWILATLVLGIVTLIFLLNSFVFGFTGNAITSDDAGKNLIDFLSKNAPSEVILKDVSSESGLYRVNVEYQGQPIPLYVTKDGKYFVQSVIPLSEDLTSSASNEKPSTEITKSDKPSVELYVFTYCPYGTQSEKGIIPVVKLLGNKIDFKIRQIGAMHGEYEAVEAKRQLCIEKEYPAKILDYVNDFALNSDIGACRGEASCVNPLIEKLYLKFGIDKLKINSCIASEGEKLYSAEQTNANSKSVSGSPTLMINGQNVQSGRDSASYLSTICSAFTEGKVPTECSTQISSASPSPGFGGTTSSSGSSASAACGV